MVIRRMLTGDPGDLTQLAEAVDPELSLAPVAMPVPCRRQLRMFAGGPSWPPTGLASARNRLRPAAGIDSSGHEGVEGDRRETYPADPVHPGRRRGRARRVGRQAGREPEARARGW